MEFKFTQKGFTLIELLVVIAIIGLLATLAVTSLNSARVKARDAKRLADIDSTKKALSLFYADTGTYAGSACAGGFPADWRLSGCDFSPYLSVQIVDPSMRADEPFGSNVYCHGANTEPCDYAFWRMPVGQHFMVFFRLEGDSSLGGGPLNCVMGESRTVCSDNISFNYCRNKEAPPYGDPDVWEKCSIFDFNQDGNVTIADYAAHDQ